MGAARGQIRDGSQESQVLAHLQTGAELTDLEALRLYGIRRLAARIFNLRRDEVPITDRTIRQGRKHFSAYRLAVPHG